MKLFWGTFPAQCRAPGTCPCHARCPAQPKQGRGLRPLVPSPEGVCMCLPSKSARSLHHLLPASFLLHLSIRSFTKRPTVYCGHRGPDQSCLCKPAHFLSQPRSIQTQQKRICCLFPLVFICYPTEDKAPRLSNGRES